MRIISCASYHGTGSSAITDLLGEYSVCHSLSDYEFRFIQDPGGISDLEYNLVENHHRLNSGYALKKYKEKVDFLAGNKLIKKYDQFFGGKWREISYEYIDELTAFTYQGYWHQDVLDRGKLFYIKKRTENKMLQHTVWKNKPERSLNELPNEITYGSMPTEGEFLQLTRNYIEQLFREANPRNRKNIIVDQIVPPSNLNRYLRYFNNIKVFVVDRDPRDIYLLEKYVWKGNIIPTDNLDVFCKWFKYTRHHRNKESLPEDKVKLIQFEDLIYKYDETVSEIEKWLGLGPDLHTEKFKFLDPKNSINNTQLWKKYKISDKELEFIESELKEYLYDYT